MSGQVDLIYIAQNHKFASKGFSHKERETQTPFPQRKRKGHNSHRNRETRAPFTQKERQGHRSHRDRETRTAFTQK